MSLSMSAVEHEYLASDEAVEELLRDWWAGKLPRGAFDHAAHVAVAASLAYDFSPAEALRMMRFGILAFNLSAGVENTDTSGYHETLTRFWSRAIGEFVRGADFPTRLDAVRAAVETYGERRDLHRRYYSFDVVKDRRARREWVPPDLEG